MGIESRGGSTLASPEGDEINFESLFTSAGVEGLDSASDPDPVRKQAALDRLEEIFAAPDVNRYRLPGEEEAFKAYEILAGQLGREPKFCLNDQGDIEPIKK